MEEISHLGIVKYPHKCGLCFKEGNWQCCEVCRRVYYCGKEHQKKDWPTHKIFCYSQQKKRLRSKYEILWVNNPEQRFKFLFLGYDISRGELPQPSLDLIKTRVQKNDCFFVPQDLKSDLIDKQAPNTVFLQISRTLKYSAINSVVKVLCKEVKDLFYFFNIILENNERKIKESAQKINELIVISEKFIKPTIDSTQISEKQETYEIGSYNRNLKMSLGLDVLQEGCKKVKGQLNCTEKTLIEFNINSFSNFTNAFKIFTEIPNKFNRVWVILSDYALTDPNNSNLCNTFFRNLREKKISYQVISCLNSYPKEEQFDGRKEKLVKNFIACFFKLKDWKAQKEYIGKIIEKLFKEDLEMSEKLWFAQLVVELMCCYVEEKSKGKEHTLPFTPECCSFRCVGK